MKRRAFLLFFLIPFALFACTTSDDSCDDLAGTVTHSTIEITGIDSTSVSKRVPDATVPGSTVIMAVDQANGSEFSNLVIDLRLSWIEEQHRFRAPNTFIQSVLDSFVSPAMACSLVSFSDQYTPAVSRIDIYSDNDFNADFPAGSNLAAVFRAAGALEDNNSSLLEAAENGSFRSARSYQLEPVWLDGVLAALPVTPEMHVFTILITLEDGRAFEVRSGELMISGT